MHLTDVLAALCLESIRNIMFRQELYHRFNVQKLMELPPARLSVSDPMDTVMKKFDETGAWNLPVEDADGHYIGFVSKSKIFNSYRSVLLELSEEYTFIDYLQQVGIDGYDVCGTYFNTVIIRVLTAALGKILCEIPGRADRSGVSNKLFVFGIRR